MDNNRLDQLKEEYLSIPIPLELDFVVRKAIQQYRPKQGASLMQKIAALTAAALLLLTVGINSSPAFAKTLAEMPVVGGIVKVLTFRRYQVKDGNLEADIKVPRIEGLKDKGLESSLNEKYLAENKRLYEEFMATKAEWEGEGHLGVHSGYEVLTDTDRLLVIKRYQLTVMGSSDTRIELDTIDKEKQILITLPSLFKDDSYVELISENIIDQMKERMQNEDGAMFWLEEGEFVEPFRRIAREQNFYINAGNKLVICFDKYEVAPGCMGLPEFVIPTEVVAAALVGPDYLK